MLIKNELVPINKYSNKILRLGFLTRINVEYPLLCREDVAKKISKVAENLPDDIKIRVDSAYRTKKTQKILWKTRGVNIENLVKNPDEGESPHCTGGAVDVSFINNGREINLSDPLRKYYNEPQLTSKNITKRSQDLRYLMNKVMLQEGFAPNPKEYWHFSYGDRVWAEYTGNEQIYKEITLDKALYYPVIKQLLYKSVKRIYITLVRLLNIETNY